jgi:hypothetical protein
LSAQLPIFFGIWRSAGIHADTSRDIVYISYSAYTEYFRQPAVSIYCFCSSLRSAADISRGYSGNAESFFPKSSRKSGQILMPSLPRRISPFFITSFQPRTISTKICIALQLLFSNQPKINPASFSHIFEESLILAFFFEQKMFHGI